MSRPGAELTTAHSQIGLVPRADLLTGAFLATLHAPGGDMWTYVDMTTRPRWDVAATVPTVRAVDLDLDVIRLLDDRVLVVDEDEFAEHQVTLGYPAEVIALAQASGEAVLAAVRRGVPPFDAATKEHWLSELAALDRQ